MAETSTIFGFMKYVSATDILSDFKKTVDSHFVNSLKVSKDTFFGSLLKFNFGYIILLVSYIFLEEGYYERF